MKLLQYKSITVDLKKSDLNSCVRGKITLFFSTRVPYSSIAVPGILSFADDNWRKTASSRTGYQKKQSLRKFSDPNRTIYVGQEIPTDMAFGEKNKIESNRWRMFI